MSLSTDMKKNHENKFKTPEGYFESFNERLFARLEAEESEPDTNFLPKSDGFTIPEGYFEVVSNKIITNMGGNESKVIQLKPWRKIYYAAASIAAIFILSLLFFQKSEPEINFEDLASADIDSYFDQNEIEFSSYEIAEVIDIETILVADFFGQDFAEDEILEYLDENVDEIEDLNLDYDELY